MACNLDLLRFYFTQNDVVAGPQGPEPVGFVPITPVWPSDEEIAANPAKTTSARMDERSSDFIWGGLLIFLFLGSWWFAS